MSPEKDRSVTAEIDDASAGINSIPSETDNKKCISCMRCIAVCPQKARSVSKALLTAGSMMLKKECSGYNEYSCAAEPPVRCGVSHLSGQA